MGLDLDAQTEKEKKEKEASFLRKMTTLQRELDHRLEELDRVIQEAERIKAEAEEKLEAVTQEMQETAEDIFEADEVLASGDITLMQEYVRNRKIDVPANRDTNNLTDLVYLIEQDRLVLRRTIEEQAQEQQRLIDSINKQNKVIHEAEQTKADLLEVDKAFKNGEMTAEEGTAAINKIMSSSNVAVALEAGDIEMEEERVRSSKNQIANETRENSIVGVDKTKAAQEDNAFLSMKPS